MVQRGGWVVSSAPLPLFSSAQGRVGGWLDQLEHLQRVMLGILAVGRDALGGDEEGGLLARGAREVEAVTNTLGGHVECAQPRSSRLKTQLCARIVDKSQICDAGALRQQGDSFLFVACPRSPVQHAV